MNERDLARVTWKKSTRSNGSGDCVEVASLPSDSVGVRDSKHPNGDVLVFTRSEWRAFIDGAKEGEFDL